MNATGYARWHLLAAAVLFSTGGAAIKSCHMTAWQVASLRCGIAAAALALLLPASRRSLSASVWPVALGYAATLLLYVLATKLTTAANAIFLQSAAPMYILLLSPWLLRERIRRSDLGVMAAVAGGLALFFLGEERPIASAPDPLSGNILALGSGLSWAFTVIGLRWLGSARETAASRDPALGAVLAGNILGFLIALPFALPWSSASAADWIVLFYLGLFQIALAYWFVTRGLKHVPAFAAALLLLVEPVLNPIWAWLGQGEVPGRYALVGGAVILAATALKSWSDARREPAASP